MASVGVVRERSCCRPSVCWRNGGSNQQLCVCAALGRQVIRTEEVELFPSVLAEGVVWVTPATIEAAQGEEVRTGLPVYSLWAERVRRRQWE